ncbi:hypothetical protein FRB90_002618 [Tulasnella sp. 427]|nr:hypothetical protein FRB90_002618 [Tulasnella sp. 427]
MGLVTRKQAGKLKAVKYQDPDTDDDAQMVDALQSPASPEEEDVKLPPVKRPRHIHSTEDENASHSPEPDSNEEDYETSHGKKRKRKTKANGKSKAKGKVKAHLDTFFDKLPLEVVYTIFSYLHPSDLLRLARTNHMLRSHLMSKSSTSIWREAREEVDPPVPDCPPDQSEPQWAYLLFTRDCSTCFRTNIPSVDWFHRLRLCSNCNRAGVNLIFGPRVKKRFHGIPDTDMLLDLLPYSNTGSSWNGKYYRIKDVEEIGVEWTALKKKGNASEILGFKERKEAETKEIMTNGAFCKAWERDANILKRQEARNTKEARKNEIFKRLEALGHDARDVRDWKVAGSHLVNSTTPLSEYRWKILQPKLEILVAHAKANRLRVERLRIIGQREDIARQLIKAYYESEDMLNTIRPSPEDVFKLEEFQAVIQLPNEATVTVASFEAATDALPRAVAAATEEIQRRLLKSMVDRGATNVQSPVDVSDGRKLELATSIFLCRTHITAWPVCGAYDLNNHKCYTAYYGPSLGSCLQYNHDASIFVSKLLKAADLDPKTTGEEMDQLDLRFYCHENLSESGVRLAMSWKSAVSRITDGGMQVHFDADHFDPSP